MIWQIFKRFLFLCFIIAGTGSALLHHPEIRLRSVTSLLNALLFPYSVSLDSIEWSNPFQDTTIVGMRLFDTEGVWAHATKIHLSFRSWRRILEGHLPFAHIIIPHLTLHRIPQERKEGYDLNTVTHPREISKTHWISWYAQEGFVPLTLEGLKIHTLSLPPSLNQGHQYSVVLSGWAGKNPHLFLRVGLYPLIAQDKTSPHFFEVNSALSMNTLTARWAWTKKNHKEPSLKGNFRIIAEKAEEESFFFQVHPPSTLPPKKTLSSPESKRIPLWTLKGKGIRKKEILDLTDLTMKGAHHHLSIKGQWIHQTLEKLTIKGRLKTLDPLPLIWKHPLWSHYTGEIQGFFSYFPQKTNQQNNGVKRRNPRKKIHSHNASWSVDIIAPQGKDWKAKRIHCKGQGVMNDLLSWKKGEAEGKIEDFCHSSIPEKKLTLSTEGKGQLEKGLFSLQGTLQEKSIQDKTLFLKGKWSSHSQHPRESREKKNLLFPQLETYQIVLESAHVTHNKQRYIQLMDPLVIEGHSPLLSQPSFSLRKNSSDPFIYPHLFIKKIDIQVGKGRLQGKNLRFFGPQAKGKITLSPLPLSTLGEIFEDWTGKLEGESHWENGTAGSLVVKTGFRLSQTTFPGLKGSLSATMNLSYQKKWLLEILYKDTFSSHLTARWTIPSQTLIPQKEEWTKGKGSVEGHLSLMPLNGLIWWGDRLRGTLHLTLTSMEREGEWPWMKGQFQIQKGRYECGRFGSMLNQINLQGTVGHQGFEFHLSGNDGYKGHFTGKGSCHWRGGEKGGKGQWIPSLALTLTQMALTNTEFLQLIVSGNLHLLQNRQGIQLGGHVFSEGSKIMLTGESVSAETMSIRSISQEKKSSSPTQEKIVDSSEPFSVGALTYDLTAETQGKFSIEGEEIKSQWKGTLHVKGPMSRPIVEGSLSPVKGEFDVVGKKMTLSPESRLFFTRKEQGLISMVELLLSKKISDITVFLHIKGPGSNPQVFFRSSPLTSQEEIMALLLFGKPLSAVSSVQAIQLATKVTAMKTGFFKGGGNLLESLESTFGLDELSLGTSSTPLPGSQEGVQKNTNASEHYSLKIGKNLGDRITLGLVQDLGGSQADTKGVLDLSLTERTKLNLEAGAKGVSVGYLWEKRY